MRGIFIRRLIPMSSTVSRRLVGKSSYRQVSQIRGRSEGRTKRIFGPKEWAYIKKEKERTAKKILE
jgi:hypothetical protein